MHANHNATPATQMGVTWHRPTTWGVTWLAGATLALWSLLAVMAVPSSSTELAASDVGLLTPSMVDTLTDVELLAGANADSLVTLTALKKLTLRSLSNIGDGTGIDVALIDTGVAPVPGLDGSKVIHGPDLSFEGASPDAAYLDTYGHGTHMAGIIAGDRPGHEGMAPGARVVSVKVSGHDGVTTVPQVIAAIDWVVEHRNTDGLNIRVLNLSLGQQGVQKHVGDMLSASVERAWDAGIFVVVAAGNDGDVQDHLDSPAIDPYVMAVGAANSTQRVRPNAYDVPDWSGQGDGARNPDLVAGGLSIASYRVPGSTIDSLVPGARYGEDLFRGSGTSQSAAAISGAAAAMLSAKPDLSNDDLKAMLRDTAQELRYEGEMKSGRGLVNVSKAAKKPSYGNEQSHPEAAGRGSGIVTPTSGTWSGGSWSKAGWSGSTWSGATWSGATWSGAQWSSATWSGATWSGATWSSATWSGATWSGATWSGATWSGATWSGKGWVTATSEPSQKVTPPVEPMPEPVPYDPAPAGPAKSIPPATGGATGLTADDGLATTAEMAPAPAATEAAPAPATPEAPLKRATTTDTQLSLDAPAVAP